MGNIRSMREWHARRESNPLPEDLESPALPVSYSACVFLKDRNPTRTPLTGTSGTDSDIRALHIQLVVY